MTAQVNDGWVNRGEPEGANVTSSYGCKLTDWCPVGQEQR